MLSRRSITQILTRHSFLFLQNFLDRELRSLNQQVVLHYSEADKQCQFFEDFSVDLENLFLYSWNS